MSFDPIRRDVLLGLSAVISARAFAQTAQPPSRGSASLADELVVANKVLVDQGALGAYDNVSVRDDQNPQRFLLSRDIPPMQVTAADILQFDLEGNPVDSASGPLILERFVHAAIYKARPDVNAVVHNHSPEIIPISLSDLPLRPVFLMGAFLGGTVPVFDIGSVPGAEGNLVSSMKIGEAVARTLGGHTMALMRGHGCVAVGATLPMAVIHAVYGQLDAKLEMQAAALGKVKFMDEREANATAKVIEQEVHRSWELWRARALNAPSNRDAAGNPKR